MVGERLFANILVLPGVTFSGFPPRPTLYAATIDEISVYMGHLPVWHKMGFCYEIPSAAVSETTHTFFAGPTC